MLIAGFLLHAIILALTFLTGHWTFAIMNYGIWNFFSIFCHHKADIGTQTLQGSFPLISIKFNMGKSADYLFIQS